MKVNMKSIKNLVTGVMNKHGGKISTAITIGAIVGSNVCTAVATKKSIDAIALKEEELQRALTKSETFKLVWKYWTGTVAFGTVGVTSSALGLIHSTKMLKKSVKKFEFYKKKYDTAQNIITSKNKLIDSYGKAVNKLDAKNKSKVSNELIKNEVDNGNIQKDVIRVYENGRQPYYDPMFRVLCIAKEEELLLAKEKVQNELRLSDQTLRDFYDIVGNITGIPVHTEWEWIGEERGWPMGGPYQDGEIDFSTSKAGKYHDMLTGEQIPCNLIEWYTKPSAV